MKSLEMLLELLRQHNLKVTPQRRVILETLEGDNTHPTADEIYQHVVATMPTVSRTTIYNTLRELVAIGVLTEVQDVNAGGIRYDTNTGPHHHLYCTHCHALVDVERDFAGLDLSPEEAVGYQVLKHQITFYGICPGCQKAVARGS